MRKLRTVVAMSLLLGSAVAGLAQVKYDVKVENKGAQQRERWSKLYLYVQGEKTPIDSAKSQNDVFVFKGEMKAPQIAYIAVGGGMRIVPFILDNQPINIVVDQDAEVKGSADNDKFIAVRKQLDEKNAVLARIRSEANAASKNNQIRIPDSIMHKIETDWEEAVKQLGATAKVIIEENKDNLIPVAVLPSYAEILGWDYVDGYLKDYKYNDNVGLTQVKRSIAGAKNKAVGAHFTDLAMKDLEGKDAKLSDFAGKGNYVLVDFWASWCGPCRREIPYLKELYKQYHPKGFEIVGVSFDDRHEAWEKAVKQLGLEWKHISDLKGWQSEAGSVYNITGIPFTLLLDPKGNIIEAGMRHEELEKKLAEIYK